MDALSIRNRFVAEAGPIGSLEADPGVHRSSRDSVGPIRPKVTRRGRDYNPSPVGPSKPWTIRGKTGGRPGSSIAISDAGPFAAVVSISVTFGLRHNPRLARMSALPTSAFATRARVVRRCGLRSLPTRIPPRRRPVGGSTPTSSFPTFSPSPDGRLPGDQTDPARRQPGGDPGPAQAGKSAAPRLLGPAQRPGAAPGAIAAVREATESIDRYPEPGSPTAGRGGWPNTTACPTDRIIVGAGTTDLIALIGQVFREHPGPQVRRELGDPNVPLAHLSEPTYGEYRRTSAQNGLNTRVWGEHILGWLQDDEPEGASGLFWTGHPNNPDRPGLGASPTPQPDRAPTRT